ncbi:TonB-dependent receptor [Massilia sp. DWR3-1-1]|uniref:TonB-dependent receptor n=1 Tax=Massilia sp. DWR3-1-1 TaxID=2804559 RepID=UPI003CFAA122
MSFQNFPRNLVAGAVLSALSSLVLAQTAGKITTVIVTATPFGSAEGDQILSPAKVLSGEDLHNKVGGSLGETLSHELGVSASAFGAGASRPIIRGLEGSRVKVLENGMAVSDISGLSNDHAVATDGPTARQIEILRGPAALLYGSGAIGGLVNVVNDRIPTTVSSAPTGEIEGRYGAVDRSGTGSLSVDAGQGPFAVHVDASARDARDYRIPGSRYADGAPDADAGTLRNSFNRQHSLGLGGSYIADWGFVGASVSAIGNDYGIPTLEASQITMKQRRYDIDSLVKNPLPGFETFKFKSGYTDYRHSELDLEGVPQTKFTNRAVETRWELTHQPVALWHGTFGMQTENTNFAALNASDGSPNTVPATRSTSQALFLVEERRVGPLDINAGARYEKVERSPQGNIGRRFNLSSYSVGALWPFTAGYSTGLTASVAQRAPTADELYAGGPHDSTNTFDIGNANFAKETSRNLELSLQKTAGLWRWKANLFQNKVKNFVYGEIDGTLLDDEGNPGDALRRRQFRQANATIRGAEAELSYNLGHDGVSWHSFVDRSRGSLDGAGSLPLQPATRLGGDVGYRQGPWRAGVSVLHALKQERLAAYERTPTDAYTQLDLNVSYTQKVGQNDVTYFALVKNLLDEDIRFSTSVLKDVVPLPGRNLVMGVRLRF